MRPAFRSEFTVIGYGWLAVLAASLSGCAHYYLPATHLETPEARGSAGIGRLELIGIQSGADLNAPPTMSTPDPESTELSKPQLQSSFANFGFGFMAAVNDRIDIGVRMQPYAPLLFRFKYQVSGVPETSAKARDFSAAIAASTGLLLGSEVTYFLGDLAVPLGYRAWDRHLFSLSPFLGFASLSGMQVPAASAQPGVKSLPATALNPTSASTMQYGISLGYQYSILGLMLRSELAYLKGSLAESQIGGLFLGSLVGFNL